MKFPYFELVSLLERLHRQCLEVVKAELDRMGVRDLNNVQALILFNIGEEEMTVGELTQRGYYLGSNVSYNVKKMVENGYLFQHRSEYDRRSFIIRASAKGLKVFSCMDGLFASQAEQLVANFMSEDDLVLCQNHLKKLERFWAAPHLFSSSTALPIAAGDMTSAA